MIYFVPIFGDVNPFSAIYLDFSNYMTLVSPLCDAIFMIMYKLNPSSSEELPKRVAIVVLRDAIALNMTTSHRNLVDNLRSSSSRLSPGCRYH